MVASALKRNRNDTKKSLTQIYGANSYIHATSHKHSQNDVTKQNVTVCDNCDKKKRLKRHKMTVCLILQYSLVLVVFYDASLLDGFHFWEKLGKILFEGVLLDGL